MSEDALDDHISWIDWRSEEEEVISAVQEQTNEPLDAIWSEGEYDGDFLVKWGESIFKIPLTISRVDRYVAICSLAEILKDKYTFFLRDGFDGSDTHGLLVVSNECADELQTNFSHWLNDYLHPLELGVDHFSGLSIPYYGHEDNNPRLRVELEEIQQAEVEFREQLQSSSAMKSIGRDLRMKLGTATLKDKLIHYLRRNWWLLLILGWFLWRNL
jgi:hypothetical protein